MGSGRVGLIPWVLAAWLHLGREVAKDLVDVPGDRVLGRRTVPIVSGEAAGRSVARNILASFIAVSMAAPLVAGYSLWYYAGAVIAVGFVWSAARALARQQYRAAVVYAKVAMPLGVAALVLGRVA